MLAGVEFLIPLISNHLASGAGWPPAGVYPLLDHLERAGRVDVGLG
jgi:hypothetical protein